MKYKYHAKLNYEGRVEDLFDSKCRVSSLPLSGAYRIRGIFHGKRVRVDVNPDRTALVFSNSQRKADNLAKEMEDLSLSLSNLDIM